MRFGGFTYMINARVVLLATIFCAATSFSTFRTGAMDEHSSMEVKYLRGDNETLVFNLRYENPFAKSVRLVALSESGDVWFQEKYRMSGELEKRVSIPRLTDTQYMTFVIRSSVDENELTYRVKVPTKIED